MPIHLIWGDDYESSNGEIEKIIQTVIDPVWKSFNHSQIDGNDPKQNLEVLSQTLTKQLNAVPQIKIDYLSFVDAESLQPVSQFNGNVCLMVAAFVGNTRLIDNLLIQT